MNLGTDCGASAASDVSSLTPVSGVRSAKRVEKREAVTAPGCTSKKRKAASNPTTNILTVFRWGPEVCEDIVGINPEATATQKAIAVHNIRAASIVCRWCGVKVKGFRLNWERHATSLKHTRNKNSGKLADIDQMLREIRATAQVTSSAEPPPAIAVGASGEEATLANGNPTIKATPTDARVEAGLQKSDVAVPSATKMTEATGTAMTEGSDSESTGEAREVSRDRDLVMSELIVAGMSSDAIQKCFGSTSAPVLKAIVRLASKGVAIS